MARCAALDCAVRADDPQPLGTVFFFDRLRDQIVGLLGVAWRILW